MIKLMVVPLELIESMKAEDIPLEVLTSTHEMLDQLSIRDVAEIELSMRKFEFKELGKQIVGKQEFSLDLKMEVSPLMNLTSEEDTQHYEALSRKVEELQLLRDAETETFVHVYTLYPVKENLWVAALQRQSLEKGDPTKRFLTVNEPFFDGLMAQTLQVHPFEKVCQTDLFTHYLKSLAA